MNGKDEIIDQADRNILNNVVEIIDESNNHQ